MRKNIVALFLLMSSAAFSQGELITTFILVRHAEKDLTQSTNDPDLSAEGKARADRLVEMLKKTDVHAIYSTPYKRTQQTISPLAAARALQVMPYEANKIDEIDIILKQHAGRTIVMAGHSNTVPQVVNYLIGEEKYKVMEDGEYDNIIVVSVSTRGKNAKVAWLKY